MNRYDSYKDSGVEWIRMIPSHWKIKKNKHISSNQKFSIVDGPFGTQLKSSEYQDYGIPLVRIVNLSFDGHFTEEGITYISESKYEEIIRSSLKIGDVIIGKTGYTIGKVGVFPFNKGTISSSCLKITPNTNLISSDLIKYIFISDGFYREVLETSKGSTRDTINIEPFSNLQLPLPPLSEQHQIVSYLDNKTTSIDSLIQSKKKKIELLKEKRTSLINQVVTKGLNPNVEMKDSGVEWIGMIPRGWEVKRVKHISKIFGRIGFRGYTTDDIVDEGEGVITISPSNIKNDVFNIENSTYLSWDKYYESPEIQIFSNDIIIVKTGSTIGKTSIIPFGTPEMTINPQLIVLKEIQLNNQYLYYQTTCKFIKESFDIEQTGSSTPTISQEKIKEFPVLNPPLSEQQEIVTYLDKETKLIDETISSEQKKIELLKEYKQSLISEVVTGKRKVTTDD